MLKGRRKAAEAGRKEAVKRVKIFRKWLDDDHEYRRQMARWTEYGEKMTAKKPNVPAALPSKTDYDIAREEGVIT